MKDLPVFATQYGVASLVLREIPPQGKAYVRLQAAQEPEKLLEECVSFCRMVGAQKVYATGHEILQQYPLHTAILKMRCLRSSLEDTDAALWPVQEETLSRFREICNQKILKIPNAAWMSEADGKQMLADAEGYFIHRGGKLLGVGRVLGDEIRFLAATAPGSGADVVKALAHAMTTEEVTVEVASANVKAMRLYEKLGFIAVEEISCWYRIYE